LGFFIVLLSLFLNNKYRAQYDRVEYPVTASRIPSFLYSGFNWWVNRPKFNSYTFGRKIKFAISKNEIVLGEDSRLYFSGWTEPENKGRWSTEPISALIFSVMGDNTDFQGKITLGVAVRDRQRLKCYLNGEKVFDDLVSPNSSVIHLKFNPQLIGINVNEYKLEFAFPEKIKTQDAKSERGSIFVSSILVQ
jgi:hypothetical protein